MSAAPTAVLYARVSTTRQANDELPLESQVEACERKAAELGSHVLKRFVDAGVSGRSDDRPQFQAALAYAEAMNVDYFITWSTSRFARNKIDASLNKRNLRRAGIKLVFCTADIDPDSDSGFLLESVLEMMDEHYSRTISKDTRRSMILNAQQGYWNGGPAPFGYAAVPVPGARKRKRLEPVADEAVIVRQLYEMRASGDGIRQLVAWLRDRDIRRHGKPMTYSPVRTLLRSRLYIGETIFGRKCTETGAIRPESEWITVASHQGIVDPKLWARVQSIMDSHSRPAPVSGRSTWLLTGLLRDPDGAALLVTTATGRSKTYSYYTSPAWVKMRSGRPQRRRADVLEDFLMEQITERVITPETMRKTAANMQQSTTDWRRQRDTELKALRAQLREQNQRRANLFELLELHGKQAPNLGDLTIRLRELTKSIRELEGEISQRENAVMPTLRNPEEVATELGDALRALLLDKSNRRKAATFLARLIDHVVIHSNRAEIVYRTEFLNETTACGAVVRSSVDWLPRTGSNRRPSD